MPIDDKSIDKLDLEIGRFNVFIGENGCGKTNVLEAVAFASSADDLGKLVLKGVRITEPKYFRCGFDKKDSSKDIVLSFFDEENFELDFSFSNSNEPYSKWELNVVLNKDPLLSD
jgi:recombinational DNA repair ATPase RecF